LLATTLPLLPRRLQLPISPGLDLPLTPGEHVLPRDVADGTVQADVAAMWHGLQAAGPVATTRPELLNLCFFARRDDFAPWDML
jgi:hypothetical protein